MTPHTGVSRRTLTTAAPVVAGGAAMATSLASPAAAAAAYTPGSYPGTAVLTEAERHLVLRFSYGLTPKIVAEVKAAGGAASWFSKQLTPPSATTELTLADWWPDLRRSPADLLARSRSGTRTPERVMFDYGRRLLQRRAQSGYQLREVLTEFWENHLHVPADGGLQFVVRAPYGDLMRAGALGRFDELLPKAILHPAMLIYLDNAYSTAAYPNENLARELLELHTVGVGNFTEDDVKACARVLTGWTVDPASGKPLFRASDHATGAVKVLGFTDANTSGDLSQVAVRLLRYLATHPATATRLMRKLATTFVSDSPSAGLVAQLSATYLSGGTSIVPVLRALVETAEFKGAVGKRLRDPARDAVATTRVLGIAMTAPRANDDDSAANEFIVVPASMGPAPMGWPAPDGAPNVAEAWSSPARVIGTMEFHWLVVTAGWPKVRATVPSPASFFPTSSRIVFADQVDHLARRLHGRLSTPALLQACCEATGLTPTTIITPAHALRSTGLTALLAVFLDHPDHLYH